MADPNPGGGQEARPLPPALEAVLQELAKALLTLEHALCFYPEGHQSRQAPLERLLALMHTEAAITGEASLGFAGETVFWRGELSDGLPAAALKLSTLLGNQGIARLGWSPGLTAGELERFLALLARGRCAGHRQGWDPALHFENLRVDALDYQALMATDAEAGEGQSAEQRSLWQTLLVRTLVGTNAELSAGELELLRGRWAAPASLAALLTEAIGPGARAGDPDAVEPVRRFAALVERAAAAGEPLPAGEVEQKLGALARRLPAALRLCLIEAMVGESKPGLFPAAFGSLDADESLALIAEAFSPDPGQIGRLTHVFQHLIPRQLERMELAPRLREEIRRAGDPDNPLADNAWEEVQELLTGESGEFMSAGYQEQLQLLATREEARRKGEESFAELPELSADLASAHLAEESLLIQFEQLRLASGIERYRDALEGVGGQCNAAFAAGDRERGMWILRRLLQENTGDELLAGPRSELERALRAIASPRVLQALMVLHDGLDAEDKAAVRTFFSLVPAAAAPVVLDALVDEEDPGRRREAVALLQGLGSAALAEMLPRLAAAPPALVRTLLPLVTDLGEPAAAPVLLGLLGRDDARVRRDALRALLSLDSLEVRRALPGLLEDRDTEIVQMAAAHLGEVGSPETVRALLQELNAGYFLGRRAEGMQRAIFVLGRMRAAEAIGPLSELLRQRAWINRRTRERISEAAAQALARIGGDAAKKSLELAAARGSDGLAATCGRLLARWGAP